MAYYHVRISGGGSHDEVRTDLDEETLERQVLAPYRAGSSITINGKTIPMAAVERVRISTSDEPIQGTMDRIRAEDRASPVAVIGGPGYRWRAAAASRDVTEQLITGPPGAELDSSEHVDLAGDRSEGRGSAVDRSGVFVVAGRDSAAVAVVVAFLRSLGLRIVEWEHAVAKTGLPNPYVGDVVATGLAMSEAAVVILTPDDHVQLRPDLVRETDGADEREIRGQARPNVYYEAGIADALGRERTVIVEIGDVKSFSDAAGRHVVRYDGSPAMRHSLAERLRVAGLDLDTTGQEWLSAGDVEPVLRRTREAMHPAVSSSGQSIVNKQDLIEAIDAVMTIHAELEQKSLHADFSDLGDESLDFVLRAQALLDRYAANTPYALEAESVRANPTHLRIPTLAATMRALRAEAEG